MKGVFDSIALHDFGSRAKGDLFLIEHKGVCENVSDTFELVM